MEYQFNELHDKIQLNFDKSRMLFPGGKSDQVHNIAKSEATSSMQSTNEKKKKKRYAPTVSTLFAYVAVL